MDRLGRVVDRWFHGLRLARGERSGDDGVPDQSEIARQRARYEQLDHGLLQ